MSLFRPAIETLTAYQPGEQPAAGVRAVKLNTNENPYPPSAAAMEVLRTVDADSLRRYPAPFADDFRFGAAEVLGVDPHWILVGNGSDDLLTMLMRAVVDASRTVAYAVPTYVLYRTLAQIQGATPAEIAYDDAYVLPEKALADTGAALTIVANPNSPSGTRTPNAVLDRLARVVRGVLVIDEAYAAFADEDALELVRRHDNVIVLRTLSKSHSLAGLRLGFGIAAPSLLGGLAKVKDSYNVDAVSAKVGAVAIRDTTYTRSIVERIRQDRETLAGRLASLGYRVWPSQANFLLVRPDDGDARRVYHGLRSHGILVRYFAEPGLEDKLRISVGTHDDHNQLIEAITRLGVST